MAPEYMGRKDLEKLPLSRLIDKFLELKSRHDMLQVKEQRAREIIAESEKVPLAVENTFMKRLLWDFVTLLDKNISSIEDSSGEVVPHDEIVVRTISFLCEGNMTDPRNPLGFTRLYGTAQNMINTINQTLEQAEKTGRAAVMIYDGPGCVVPAGTITEDLELEVLPKKEQ